MLVTKGSSTPSHAGGRPLVDNKAAPDLSNGEPVLLPYADNLNVAGIDRNQLQKAKESSCPAPRTGFSST